MNKLEYLGQLETILKKKRLSRAEVDDIIRDYAEFFEEGRRQGQSDAEISAKLGSPELIAQQLSEESEQEHNSTPKPGFKLSDLKLPKFDLNQRFGMEEKEPQAPKAPRFSRAERKSKESQDTNSNIPPYYNNAKKNSGCLGAAFSGLLKLCFYCVAVPTIACLFAAAVCCFGTILATLLTLFVMVIIGFFMAAFASHFMSLAVTIFSIFTCVALLSLLVSLTALTMDFLIRCCKAFMKLLGQLFHIGSGSMSQTQQSYYAAPMTEEPLTHEETIYETIEEEVPDHE